MISIMKQPLTFLRLYVNPAWRRDDSYSSLMIPFWGNPHEDTRFELKELFDAFSFDTRYYGITDDITQADMVFVPYRQWWLVRTADGPRLLKECAEAARNVNLPLLVDGIADGEHLLNIDNAYVLRIGGYRFLRKQHNLWGIPPHIRWEPNRIEVPTQPGDFLHQCRGGILQIRPKREGVPVVSFAGIIRTTFKNMMHERLNELPLYLHGMRDTRYNAMSLGYFWRTRALRILEKSDKVACSFDAQDMYSSSTSVPRSPQERKQMREQFVQRVLDSDYALDVRGNANASLRLYEILSLGRIPVILDTERILPFQDVVDWSRFSLIVDFRDIKYLPDIIADFHASVTPERFEDMQRAAREAYVKHFRVDAQLPHILREINKLRGV